MLDHLRFGTFVFFGVRTEHITRRDALTDTALIQAFSFLGGLFIMFLVPETKGLSLEEMDAVFGSSAGREDVALKHQVRLPPRELGVTYKVTRRLTRRCARRSRKTWACSSSCGNGHARAGVRQLLVLVAIIVPIEQVDIA